MTVLYLLTRNFSSDQKAVTAALKNAGVKRVYLVPLEYGCEEKVSRFEELWKIEGIDARTCDFLSRFNQQAFQEKDNYIKFFAEVGDGAVEAGRSLKEHLRLFNRNFSLWWFSLIAEKNSYRSLNFTKLAKIKAIAELKAETLSERIWAEGDFGGIAKILRNIFGVHALVNLKKQNVWGRFKESPMFFFLEEQLRAAKYFFEILGRAVKVRRLARSFKNRLSHLKASRFLLLTMFPLLDKKALEEENRFVNRAYGALHDGVKDRCGGSYTWIAMYTYIEGYRFDQALKLASQVNRSEPLFFFEEFMHIKEFFKIIGVYFYSLMKTLFFWPRYGDCFFYDFGNGARSKVWPLFKKEFISSFAGKELMVSLCFYYAFERMLNQFNQTGKVVYFSEMHAWENVLNISLKKHPSMTAVGLQHTIVPLLLLNYFHGEGELAGHSSVEHFPRPHFLACTGEVTRQLFLENKWPQSEILILGAFRFQRLLSLLNGQKLKDRASRLVVAAFSISDIENEEVLRLLHAAFNRKS